jgi:hypothetical protein
MLDWVVIPMKLEGIIAKHPEPRPLFGVERGRTSKDQQFLIKLITQGFYRRPTYGFSSISPWTVLVAPPNNPSSSPP